MKLYQLIAEILREGLGPLRKRITFVRLDDMVFEGREKDYGAYALRRKYPWHLVLALGLVTQLVWLGVFGPVWMYVGKSSPVSATEYRTIFCELSPPPPPLPRPPMHEPRVPPSLEYLYRKGMEEGKLDDSEEIFRIPRPDCVEAVNSVGQAIDERQYDGWLIPDPEVEEDSALEAWSYFKIETVLVEEEPEPWVCDFPGEIEPDFEIERLQLPQEFLIPDPEMEEDTELEVYSQPVFPESSWGCILPEEPQPLNMPEIIQLIQYPSVLLEAGVSGYVVVRMLVGKEGQYLKHKVINTPHPILTEEVEKHLPKLRFTPAYQGHKPIRYWVNIPFNLDPRP